MVKSLISDLINPSVSVVLPEQKFETKADEEPLVHLSSVAMADSSVIPDEDEPQ